MRIILIINNFFHFGKPNPQLVKVVVVQRWKQMRAFQESNTAKEEIKRPFKSAVFTPS